MRRKPIIIERTPLTAGTKVYKSCELKRKINMIIMAITSKAVSEKDSREMIWGCVFQSLSNPEFQTLWVAWSSYRFSKKRNDLAFAKKVLRLLEKTSSI